MSVARTMTLRTTLAWDGAPATADEIAEVRLDLIDGALIVGVDAPYHGDPAPVAAAGPVDRLWETEVVELFVGAELDGRPVYLEVELGPGGHHLVLMLDGVRNPIRTLLPLEFEATVEGGRWRGRALVPAALLPPAHPSAWRVNATACHGPAEARRYLTAARLTALAPDFHRPHEWIPFG